MEKSDVMIGTVESKSQHFHSVVQIQIQSVLNIAGESVYSVQVLTTFLTKKHANEIRTRFSSS